MMGNGKIASWDENTRAAPCARDDEGGEACWYPMGATPSTRMEEQTGLKLALLIIWPFSKQLMYGIPCVSNFTKEYPVRYMHACLSVATRCIYLVPTILRINPLSKIPTRTPSKPHPKDSRFKTQQSARRKRRKRRK